MSEKCEIRSVDAYNFKWVAEPNLPLACIQCIHRALSQGRAQQETIDTNERAAATFSDFYGDDASVGDADRWESTIIERPDATSARRAEIAVGYDIDTHSYEEDSTITVQKISFNCDNE